jgi:toxin-antitoxin system PIN domain toxin
MVALFDVNVLVALFDPAHVHHDAAHAWFGEHRALGWATCALTENGLVRVLSNPAYPGRRTSLQDATSRLGQFCSSGGHAFWVEPVSLRDAARFRLNHVQGHRQLTDVYLLALAVERQGRLVTFDGSIPIKSATGATSAHLVVVGR